MEINKLKIGGGLVAIFIITLFISRSTFGFDGLLSLIGITVGPVNTQATPLGEVAEVVTPTPAVRVTSDTNLVSLSPVGVTSDTNYKNSNVTNGNEYATSSPVVTTSPSSSAQSLVVTPTPAPTGMISPTPTGPTLEASQQSAKININTADKEELMTLKGIKDAKSEAVIQYRETNGPFKKVEDIMDVSGIGPGIFDWIKGFITVGS